MVMILASVLIAFFTACDRAAPNRPNVLFVVWDTTRADRMSLYGHDRPTTPFLEQWAQSARVFENCLSTGSSTVPSHGAMFTGLFPSEHGANNKHRHLDDRHLTLAEIFQQNGYATFLFSANPHISEDENFAQGFDTQSHPWDTENQAEALRIVSSRINPKDRSNNLRQYIKNSTAVTWSVKACGELAQKNLCAWLDAQDGERPFFAFLNYMEAHQPYVPRDEFRRRMMTAEQMEQSFKENFSWMPVWKYNFRLREYSSDSLDLVGRIYDACIAELDDLFKNLMIGLEDSGCLENTIIVLTGDHGEHLGEHHLLDHQFSLYEELLRVPLVLYFPDRVAPGRETAQVVNFDIFPTLIELAGITPPPGIPAHAKSLLAPQKNRLRLAEYPSDFCAAINSVKAAHANWDPTPFRRRLTAFYHGDFKLIWASDGTHELYDLSDDPQEARNLAASNETDLERMQDLLRKVIKGFNLFDYSKAELPDMSQEQLERLRALGYTDGGSR